MNSQTKKSVKAPCPLNHTQTRIRLIPDLQSRLGLAAGLRHCKQKPILAVANALHKQPVGDKSSGLSHGHTPTSSLTTFYNKSKDTNKF